MRENLLINGMKTVLVYKFKFNDFFNLSKNEKKQAKKSKKRKKQEKKIQKLKTKIIKMLFRFVSLSSLYQGLSFIFVRDVLILLEKVIVNKRDILIF